MRQEVLQREVQRIRLQMPAGDYLGVLGSTSPTHPLSEACCVELGRRLAQLPGVSLVTGGMHGVAETVSNAFLSRIETVQAKPRVISLVPFGHAPVSFGLTLHTGTSLPQRRAVLARVAPVYVCIEGGPGTQDEVVQAAANGAIVLPLAALGGYAAEAHERATLPVAVDQATWLALDDELASPEQLAEAVVTAVAQLRAHANGA